MKPVTTPPQRPVFTENEGKNVNNLITAAGKEHTRCCNRTVMDEASRGETCAGIRLGQATEQIELRGWGQNKYTS